MGKRMAFICRPDRTREATKLVCWYSFIFCILWNEKIKTRGEKGKKNNEIEKDKTWGENLSTVQV